MEGQSHKNGSPVPRRETSMVCTEEGWPLRPQTPGDPSVNVDQDLRVLHRTSQAQVILLAILPFCLRTSSERGFLDVLERNFGGNVTAVHL